MNKFLLFILSLVFGFSLNGQIPDLPEILQEQFMQEKYDLTYNQEIEEQEKSEDDYYRYIPRNGGTDTLYGYKWNRELEEWILRCRIIKTLNDEELPTEKLVQIFTPDSLWLDGLFFEYSYNDGYDLTEVVIQHYRPDSMVWVNHFRMERTYNDDGNLNDILTQWWSRFNEEWVDHHNKVFTYNNDLLVADTVKIYFHFSDEWRKFFYNEYGYNDSGLKITKTNYLWSPFFDFWLENYRLVYSYDDAGENIILVTGQVRPSPDADWKDVTRYNYTWDDDDNLSLYVFEKWIHWDSVWVEKVMIDYTYDDAGNLSQFVWQFKPMMDTVWHNFKQAFFTYDDMGNMLEKTEQRWAIDEEDWVNFRRWVMAIQYNVITDIYDNQEEEIKAIFRNPYQNGDMIQLDGLEEKPYTAQIFDINGRVVETYQLSGNNQFVLQNKLNTGLYILTISDGQKVYLKRKLMVAN